MNYADFNESDSIFIEGHTTMRVSYLTVEGGFLHTEFTDICILSDWCNSPVMIFKQVQKVDSKVISVLSWSKIELYRTPKNTEHQGVIEDGDPLEKINIDSGCYTKEDGNQTLEEFSEALEDKLYVAPKTCVSCGKTKTDDFKTQVTGDVTKLKFVVSDETQIANLEKLGDWENAFIRTDSIWQGHITVPEPPQPFIYASIGDVDELREQIKELNQKLEMLLTK